MTPAVQSQTTHDHRQGHLVQQRVVQEVSLPGSLGQRAAGTEREGSAKVVGMMVDQASEAVGRVLQSLQHDLWIVTAADGDRRGGLVATWVMQASLDTDPGIMVISLATNHFTRELVDASGVFGLHVLGQRHASLAVRFATRSGRDIDKLAGIAWTVGATGAPRLDDVLGWLDCQVIARMSSGDRIYYWAEVIAGGGPMDEPPMTDMQWLSQLGQEDLVLLQAGRNSDIRLHRPLFDQWRKSLPKLLRLA